MISRSAKRYALIVLAALIVVAALFVALRGASQQSSTPDNAARASFIAACKEQGRIANGGGSALRMDDTTEEGLDLYCSCVADHFDRALTPAEIQAVGDGSASKDVLAKLNAVMSTCQAEHLAPAPGATGAPDNASGSNNNP